MHDSALPLARDSAVKTNGFRNSGRFGVKEYSLTILDVFFAFAKS
jgi:hypothetical protein